MSVLFVGSSNLCRSAAAERLLAASAAERLGTARAALQDVSSAGLDTRPELPMDRRTHEALSRLGLDPSDFRTRVLDPTLPHQADLVLTMTRADRTATLLLAPRTLHRTFTLLEAADLVRRADLSGLAELPLATRTAALATRLSAARSARQASAADDLPDPHGRRAGIHSDVTLRIREALRPLSDVLFADGPPLREPTPPRDTRDIGRAALTRGPAVRPTERKRPKKQRAVTSRNGR